MQLTPEMIREQRFKVKFSGFDKDEVTGFLLDIAEDVEELLEENSLLKSELDTLKNKQKDLEDLFLSAKQFSDEKIEKAREQGETIVAQAKKNAADLEEQARQVIADAENKSREIQDETQNKAAEILSDAQQRTADLENEINELKTKRADLFNEFTSVLESYQKWIREMQHVDTR